MVGITLLSERRDYCVGREKEDYCGKKWKGIGKVNKNRDIDEVKKYTFYGQVP